MPRSLPRFFIPLPLSCGESLSLPKPIIQHVHALRLGRGDVITLFNGVGGEFEATLVTLAKVQATVILGTHHWREVELPYQITLAQSMISQHKMDWLIEKACELGISAVIPLITSRSVIQHLSDEQRQRRCAHWQALVCAACEQCGRNQLPIVHAPILFNPWLTTCTTPLPAAFTRLILSPHAMQDCRALPLHAPADPITLLVGPEGGFTEAEANAAMAHGFTALHLGPRILRSETAGIAMLAGLTMRWGEG